MDATPKVIPETTVQLMWEGGPLRRLCAVAFSAYIPYNGDAVKGYVGPYVCAKCNKDCSGVYYVHGFNWVCGTCRPFCLHGGVPVALKGSQGDGLIEVPAVKEGETNEESKEQDSSGRAEEPGSSE